MLFKESYKSRKLHKCDKSHVGQTRPTVTVEKVLYSGFIEREAQPVHMQILTMPTKVLNHVPDCVSKLKELASFCEFFVVRYIQILLASPPTLSGCPHAGSATAYNHVRCTQYTASRKLTEVCKSLRKSPVESRTATHLYTV